MQPEPRLEGTLKHLALKAESQGWSFPSLKLGVGQGQGKFPLACYPTKDHFGSGFQSVQSVVTKHHCHSV